MTTLLERETELAALDALLERGGVLVVEGGAGVGKTSLVEAASRRAVARGHDVLRARGSEREADFAFGVVRQLFERRLTEADDDERERLLAGPTAAVRPLLLGQPVGAASADDTSFAVLHGLYWLAANAAALRPLLLAVDDAHWADEPSLRWLAYLAPRLEGLPLALLIALRPGEPASMGASLLTLRTEAPAVVHPAPLSEAAVRAMVGDAVGDTASDSICAAIWTASGGNPLYLTELLRAIRLGHRPLAELDPAELLVGGREAIARRVVARVRGLDPRALALAQALAVLGDGCALRHAAAIAAVDMADAVRLAAGLVRREVLASDDPPCFTHPVVRDALEASLAGDERDDGPLPCSPEEAWSSWGRAGVAQFRQPHLLHATGRRILDAHLPEVTEALLQAGGVTFDYLTLMPPSIADRAPRPGDERFVTVTGRRPALEYAVARAAEEHVTVVRGAPVAGLLTGPPATTGLPHVAGVRTAEGAAIRADLVVDATGRRSKLPDWLAAMGARRPIEEAEESRFIYYSRYFRSATGALSAYRAPVLTDFPTFSLLTLPGDAHTWSVTVYTHAGDPALKALRDPARWTRLVAACPAHAHWLDGEPITDVLPMGGVTDRYRRFVVDGSPVATGVVAVGDAWACTNPIQGRGITMGLMHAVEMAEVVRQHLDAPLALALAHDSLTDERVTPWYRDTVAFDRRRAASITATLAGRAAPPPTGPLDLLPIAMMHDADLFRAFFDITSMHALPREVLARPGVADRIVELAGAHEPLVPPGPAREEVLRMVA